MKRFVSVMSAVALGCAGIGTAPGQGIIGDPTFIAGCLCENQGLDAWKARVDAAQRLYDHDRAQIDTFDRRLERLRATVNAGDEEAVGAVRNLNIEREQLYARTYDVEFPALQAAIRSYDQAARHYGGQCLGRQFDSIRMAQIQASLACPAP